jgi:hypothetical protein
VSGWLPRREARTTVPASPNRNNRRTVHTVGCQDIETCVINTNNYYEQDIAAHRNILQHQKSIVKVKVAYTDQVLNAKGVYFSTGLSSTLLSYAAPY